MTRVRLLVLALISVLTAVVTVQAWTEAKSADIELTRIGIDLKGAIERLREQVQNVE